MTVSTPHADVRFRRFVPARFFGTAGRVAVMAAVLFQLLLRGIALPEPVAGGGTDGRPAPHVHLSGHLHHHHDHHGHHHGRGPDEADHWADHHHGEHAADEHGPTEHGPTEHGPTEHGPTEHGQCCDRWAVAEGDGSHPPRDTCPADHDNDAIYLDASLVITPAAERILLAADDAPINWPEPPATASPATGRGCPGNSAPGGPPPDFRGRFPHRLQV